MAALVSLPFIASILLIILSGAGTATLILTLMLLTTICTYYASLLGLLNLPTSIIEIEFTSQEIKLKAANSKIYHAVITRSSILLPSFGWLTFKCIDKNPTSTNKQHIFGQYKHVLVCRHTVDEFDDYRNLRVVARFKAHA